jgi:formylglycine-generating enzyme required for sulfatase activity
VYSPDQSEGDVADIPFFPNPYAQEERHKVDRDRIARNPNPDACHYITEILHKTYTSDSTGMEFVLIPSGEFIMGSPTNEQGKDNYEGPAHEVIIKNSFYIGKFPVTQKQWEKIFGSNPSRFRGEEQPVEYI